MKKDRYGNITAMGPCIEEQADVDRVQHNGPRPRRVLSSLLLATALVASACGGSDDSVDTNAEAGDSSAAGESIGGGLNGDADDTEEADVAEEVAEEPEAADEEVAGGEESAESAELGRTGPVRDLAGFAAWSDVDLHPFLVEVITYPEELPLPEGLMLTSMDGSQNFWQEGSESSYSVTLEFLPSFDRDAYRETIPAMMEGIGWIASGIDEDLENNSTQLTFTPPDEGNPVDDVYYTYRDGDTNSQPELRLYVSGEYIVGQTEPVFNPDVWGWILTPNVEPSLTRDSIYISVDSYGDDVSYSLRWEGPVGTYDSLVDFYTANDFGADLVRGAVEVSDDPWPSTEFEATRASDGFDGELEISLYDEESEPTVKIGGNSPLGS